MKLISSSRYVRCNLFSWISHVICHVRQAGAGALIPYYRYLNKSKSIDMLLAALLIDLEIKIYR